jgi:UDP-N-acetylglucosamine acyltransferase
MSNTIHPTAIIAPSVVLGDGNYIGPYTTIEGRVRIGEGNWIGPHVTIGTPAQYTTEKFELNGERETDGITIGNRCVFREYVTVHQPAISRTVVEDDCYFMAYCHISHDTVIRRNVNLANNTQIAGFTEIQEFANVGLSVAIHQYSTIGAYAMIGMSAVISKDVPPFAKVAGNPPRLRGINAVGMSRAGFDEAIIEAVREASIAGTLDAQDDRRVAEIMRRFAERRTATHRDVLRNG